MPQLNIYLDEPTHRAVVAAAKKEHKSLSLWAREHLAEAAEKSGWPKGYFEYFANLDEDPTFKVAEPTVDVEDSPRESF